MVCFVEIDIIKASEYAYAVFVIALLEYSPDAMPTRLFAKLKSKTLMALVPPLRMIPDSLLERFIQQPYEEAVRYGQLDRDASLRRVKYRRQSTVHLEVLGDASMEWVVAVDEDPKRRPIRERQRHAGMRWWPADIGQYFSDQLAGVYADGM